MRFQTVEEVISIIEQRKNKGYGLDHFKDYMNTLGNPHHKLKSIHIAGTNGKGSTTNDLRSILEKAGYKVGTFTSPYMITHLDRIRINNQDIPKETFLDISNRYYDSWMKWDLSMFEIDMCIATIFFLESRVDICIFETGLGGRLDSTNILTPLVSVITNIGMDHMEFLGNTKEKIAQEKAGIIKENIDLITAEEDNLCLDVFFKTTKEKHAQCIQSKQIHNIKHWEHGLCFDYGDLKDIQLFGDAKYQCKNASLAIEVCTYLNNTYSMQITENCIREGLKEAVWIGRYETISKDPFILIDGAHNADGIRALCENLKEIKNLQIIFSVLKDKNYNQMLEELEKVCKEIIVVPFYNERALDVEILKKRPQIKYMSSYEEAISYAVEKKQPLVITGSLYFISDVRKYLLQKGYRV